jgi:opacity protein-like surface antigen
MRRLPLALLSCATLLLAAGDAAAANTAAPAARQVFYGDLHIHTALSADAFSTGTRTLPDDAYRYAKGEAIAHGAGFTVQLKRPLDFAAVTEHSEYLGSMREFLNPASPLSRHPLAKLFASPDPADAFKALMQISDDASHDGSLDELLDLPEVNMAAWREVIAAAERHNEPGRFTTLIGYEWTSTPDEINLHRNVLFRGSAVPATPFSRIDSDKPEDLWRFLDEQRAQGIEGMAIPHNSNASDGMMWARMDSAGQPVDAAWARQRSRNEPIAEIVQIKGQSEAHPLLSTEDEFANYEMWTTRMSGAKIPRASKPEGSYARDALKTGLSLGASLGVNPYDFGMIGSSDTHNSAPPIEEDNYHGKLTQLDGTAAMRAGRVARSAEARAAGRETAYSAAGLAAVWADANTREAIYDALRRKETFATSGTRISLRFFGGWEFAPALVQAPDFVAQAYASGVPMGSQLPAGAARGAPRFAVLRPG